MRAPWITPIASLFAVALAACGGPSDEEKIRTTIRAYYGAFAAGDGEKACAQLADEVRDEFTLRSRAPGCPDAIERATRRPDVKPYVKQLGDARVQSVEVHGKTAKAHVRAIGQSTDVALVKEGDRWKIQARPDAPSGS